jgi:hypothetical protein
MVEVRDRLIKAIRSGILNGPKEDIPVSLKDFDDFKEQVKSEIIETIRDELRTPDSAKEGS